VNVKQTAADLGLKTMNAVHRTVIVVSGGRLGHHVAGMQAVRLHTTGRKSGQPRSVLLTAPICDDERVVLIASKGGDDRNPEWYLNLSADPDVELTINDTTSPWRARTASADEKAELWPQITATYKGYAGYQKRTERDIPVVICEPR
jgi:deazaflavin-dependent oxidoreductase (nitroreductase family)